MPATAAASPSRQRCDRCHTPLPPPSTVAAPYCARCGYALRPEGSGSTLPAALLAMMLAGADAAHFLPTAARHAKRLGIADALPALQVSTTAGLVVGAILFGIAADRAGRRSTLIGGLSLFMMASIYLEPAGSALFDFIAARVLASAGLAATWVGAVTLGIEGTALRRRAIVAGLLAAAYAVGEAAGHLLHVGARLDNTFIPLLVVGATLAIFLPKFTRESHPWLEARRAGREHRATAPPRTDFGPGPELANALLAAALGIVAAIAAAASSDVAVRHADAAGEPLLARLLGLPGFLVVAILGTFVRRRLGLLLLCLLSALAVGLSACPRGPAGLLAATLAGSASVALSGWLVLQLPELFPTRIRGTGMGVTYAVRLIAVTSLIAALPRGMADRGLWPVALAACGAGMLLALILPQTGNRPLPE